MSTPKFQGYRRENGRGGGPRKNVSSSAGSNNLFFYKKKVARSFRWVKLLFF